MFPFQRPAFEYGVHGSYSSRLILYVSIIVSVSSLPDVDILSRTPRWWNKWINVSLSVFESILMEWYTSSHTSRHNLCPTLYYHFVPWRIPCYFPVASVLKVFFGNGPMLHVSRIAPEIAPIFVLKDFMKNWYLECFQIPLFDKLRPTWP